MVLFNEKNINPYHFLDVSESITINELKKIYKNICKTYHPDINKKIDTEFFTLILLCIDEIKSHIKKKDSIKNASNELKNNYANSVKSSVNSLSSVKKLMKDNNNNDLEKFNKFFDENKIEDENNVGYTTNDFIEEPKIDIKITKENFNDNFNKHKNKNINNYAIMKKTSISNTESSNLNCSLLGEHNITDYSNINNNLKYTDYKLAFNGYNYLIENDNSTNENITKDEYKFYTKKRNETNFEMTNVEKKQQEYEKNIQLKEETKRQARLRDYDINIQNKYSELQGKLLS